MSHFSTMILDSRESYHDVVRGGCDVNPFTLRWARAPVAQSIVRLTSRMPACFCFSVPQVKGELFEALVDRSLREPIATWPEKRHDYVVGFEHQITDDAAN